MLGNKGDTMDKQKKPKTKLVVRINNKPCKGKLLSCPANTSVLAEDYDAQLEAVDKEMQSLRERLKRLQVKKKEIQLQKQKAGMYV